MGYYVGDTPLETIKFDDLPLGDWTLAAATITAPDGDTHTLPATIDDDTVEVVLDIPLELAGVHTVTVTVHDAAGAHRMLPTEALLVEDPATRWHTLASARGAWRDAPAADLTLHELLEVAREQCEAYAPALPDGAVVPIRWKSAQLMQARNIWNASKTDPEAGGFGDEGFVIRPYPLDWTIKQMLHPKTRIPVIG